MILLSFNAADLNDENHEKKKILQLCLKHQSVSEVIVLKYQLMALHKNDTKTLVRKH